MLQDVINFHIARKTYLIFKPQKLIMKIIRKLSLIFLSIPTNIKYVFFPYDAAFIYRIFKIIETIGLFVNREIIQLKKINES